jgi:DNA processing protein
MSSQREAHGPALSPDTAALVALLQAGKRPGAAYAELVEVSGSAQAILEQEHGLLASDLLDTAADAVTSWVAQGIRLLTVLDDEYPENLRAVHDRPPLLFVAGRLEPRDARSVAVIGSRRASAAGVGRAQTIAEHLVGGRYTVVSGLAAGIDTAAHTTALGCGGRTVAVIGTGLNRAYPPQNAPLQRRIAGAGAVISQFWPDGGASRQSFPARNALMSGLTLATVVVEATQTSGARTQARRALAHGRPVLLASSLLKQQWASELAARPGTHVFTSPGDLMALVERLSSTGTLVA